MGARDQGPSGMRGFLVKVWQWPKQERGLRTAFHLFIGLVGVVIVAGCTYFAKSGSKFNVLTSTFFLLAWAYLVDFWILRVEATRDMTLAKRWASPFSVLIVAWLLPFALTVIPGIALANRDDFLLAIAGSTKPEAHTLYLWHSFISGSLVVFIPLEFFTLFVLSRRPTPGEEPKQSEYNSVKHALITSGCLDVVTLLFLSQVATVQILVEADEAYKTLIAGMLLVFICSMISSLQAIYRSQFDSPALESSQSPQVAGTTD